MGKGDYEYCEGICGMCKLALPDYSKEHPMKNVKCTCEVLECDECGACRDAPKRLYPESDEDKQTA